MTETNNLQAAAQCLRMALPLMTKHNIAVTPENYAVWYEYVLGVNSELREAMDTLIAKQEPITEEITRGLYRRHLTEHREEKLFQAKENLQALIDDIGGSVSKADGEVCRYEESLAGYTHRLTGEVSTEELREVVGSLASETKQVRESGSRLHDRLEESRREVEELRKELVKARSEASTDALTGLANRKGFFEALTEMAEEEADSQGLCLLIADIDKFKNFNDTYGHLLGDKVIKFVGTTMQKGVKGKDLVARYGGEEFAVLLPDTPFEGAMAVAENIRQAVESGRLVRADTRESIGSVTVSSGVALYRRGEPFDDFIQRADEALYRSKEGGRNRVSAEEQPLASAV